MMDFLTALLDRTLDRAPVLERRRPSLFEPSGGIGPSPAPLEEFVEEVEAAAPAQPLRPEIANAAPSSQPVAAVGETPPPVARAAPSPPTAAPPALERPAPGETSRFREAPPQSAPAVTVKRIETTERIIERETEIVRLVKDGAPLAGTQQERARPRGAPPIEPRPVRTKHDIVETRTGRREPSLKPPDAPALVRPAKAAPPAPVLAAPARPAMRPLQPAPAREQEHRSAEPAIHVTIGRVEIRAVPPPPGAAAAKPATPKLKLEDYLRARSGGRL
jgi:hypothetical protein